VTDPFLPDRRIRGRVFAALLVALVLFGWFDVRAKARVGPDEHKTDFTCYTAAATAMLDGRHSPYDAANVNGWPYIYPPLFGLLVAPIRGWSYEWQQMTWFVLNVLFAWGAYRESVRLVHAFGARRALRRDQPVPRWLLVTGVLTVIGPATSVMRGGQVGLLLLYLTLLGLRLALTGSRWQWAMAGTVWALAVAIKVLPIFPAAALLVLLLTVDDGGVTDRLARPTWFGGGLAVGLVLWLLVVPAVALGWSTNLAYLAEFNGRVLQRRALDDARDAAWANKSLVHAARRATYWAVDRAHDPGRDGLIWWTPRGKGTPLPLPLTPAQRVAGVAVILTLGAGLLAFLWRLGRERSAVAVAAGVGVSWSVTLAASPLTWGHYFVLVLPAAAYLPLWAWSRGWSRAALTIAGSGLAVAWSSNDPFNAWVPARWMGVWHTAWLAVVLVWACRAPGPDRAAH
jgi:hypothetical protein